ncbi:hypothetical protein [uncultured Polaribacter sp.]|uniref:hypothetical protein n=1 Tax=uncultured Polaribacter sp. TaxID=174711 RepID=UPI002635C104|nr:hypothetical protein [uncultured Polaribacter sp.]
MELTKEQLLQIDNYLKEKKFDFIDLKIEVLDHIISDIESLVIKGYTFSEAFIMVKIRWEKHFRETSSFYFGLQFSESKIVVKKAKKIFKKYYFIYLATYIFPLILFKKIPFKVENQMGEAISTLTRSLAVLATIYILYMVLKTTQTKVKSTYRFILKTQYLGVIFLVILTFLDSINDKDGFVNPLFASFTGAGFSALLICNHFYKKHKEAILKNRIS